MNTEPSLIQIGFSRPSISLAWTKFILLVIALSFLSEKFNRTSANSVLQAHLFFPGSDYVPPRVIPAASQVFQVISLGLVNFQRTHRKTLQEKAGNIFV
tara:strand:+ start:671 stop:967 length:297 start_codon:yes stop_codon:yes gene_type:complete